MYTHIHLVATKHSNTIDTCGALHNSRQNITDSFEFPVNSSPYRSSLSPRKVITGLSFLLKLSL